MNQTMTLTPFIERFAPIGAGVVSLVLIYFFRSDISAQFVEGGWKVDGLYNAVFNWASIQSGFVFGVYGFIASKRDGFVGELAKGRSFDTLLTYSRRAYMTGFGLTFVSLPVMIVEPTISQSTSQSFWIIAIWFSLFCWTFCAFLRVAFLFGMVAATPDRKPEIMG